MRRAAVLMSTLALLGAACSSAGARHEIVIGTMYTLTGLQSVAGSQEHSGVALAADWVNEHGGVNGRSVRLVSVDAPRAESVPAALAELRAQHVVAVIGSHGSSLSAIAAREATTHNMSFFETGAVGELPPGVASGRNFFRLAPTGATLGSAAIRFVHDVLAPRRRLGNTLRWAVAYVDDPYGRAVAKGASDEIARRKLHAVGNDGYDPNHVDFQQLSRRIAAQQPDVLFVSAYLADGVALRRALIAQHLPIKVLIGTSSSFCMPEFGDRLGSAAVGLFASDKPDAGHLNVHALRSRARAALSWAARTYRQRFGTTMSAPALSGFSNALAVLGTILPAARGDSTGAIAEAATSVQLPAGSLPNGAGLALAPSGARDMGDNRLAESVIWEWVAPRTRAVVWPAAFATRAIADVAPAP